MSDEMKGVTIASMFWLLIIGSYAYTTGSLMYVDSHTKEIHLDQLQIVNQLKEQRDTIEAALYQRDQRMNQVDKEYRQEIEARSLQLRAALQDALGRLDQLSQQQAEMRADLRNLKDLKEDIKTLLSKRR